MRSGTLLGDASYALYLSHPLVMSAFAMIWFAAGANNTMPGYLGAGVSIMLAVAASILVYRWFEFPLTRFLQRRIRFGEKVGPADLKPLPQQV